MTSVIPLALVLVAFSPSESTPMVQRAIEHLEENPVEVFGDQPRETRVRGNALLDIDGDETPEVFVWIEPHFRQSPTIIIYRGTEGGNVQRIAEALAPGTLVPVSGGYIDAHVNGDALDMWVGSGSEYDLDGQLDSTVVRISLGRGFHIVKYASFVHLEHRRGSRIYLDESHQWLPDGVETCAEFEFERVRSLAAGAVSGLDDPALVALTDSKVAVYQLRGIDSDGLLDKDIWTLARPHNLRDLDVNDHGHVTGVMYDGTHMTIRVGKP